MMSWRQFREARPDLADAGQRLLYQYGVGLAFLASVRRDGGPRVHPMCPLLTPEGLFAFLVPSPKRDDLHRDDATLCIAFPSKKTRTPSTSPAQRFRSITTNCCCGD